MSKTPEQYRDVPFRPPRDEHGRGVLWRLCWRFFQEFCQGYRGLLVGCVLLQLVAGSTAFVITFTTRHMVDRILVIEPGAGEDGSASDIQEPPLPARSLVAEHEARLDVDFGTPQELWRFLGLFLLVVFALNCAGRLSQRLRTLASLQVCGRLREAVHRKVLALDYANFQVQSPGRLMSYIITDVTTVQTLYVEAMVLLFVESLLISSGICLLFWLHPWLALMVAVFLPLHAILYVRIKMPQQHASRELRHTNSCLWNFTTQRLNGIKTIIAFAQERMEHLNFFRLGACYVRDAVLVQRCSAIINANAWLIEGLGTGLVYIVGTIMVVRQQMGVGDLVMFYGVTGFLFARILQLSSLNAWFAQLNAVLHRLFLTLDTPIVVKDKPGAKPFPEDIRGRIQFDDITFDYAGGERPSLSNVSFTIEPGQWLCVMGASGSGKSTIVGLLTRLYDAQSGQIRIDDIPLSDVQLTSLRRTMVLVPQEPQIFSGTIADNICYNATEFVPSRIMQVARDADLHDTIMRLPAKYETVLGEKGISLSGGQRQRLSLARALMTDPRILILDDCTSALDARTEQKIQDTLARIMRDRTALIVSQRFSMARRCHRILVLDHGRVAEYGSHDELMRQNGFYASLVRRQTMGHGGEEVG